MSNHKWRRGAMAAAIVAGLACPAAAQQEEMASWSIPGWTFTPGLTIGGVFDSNVALADAPAETRRTQGDQLFLIQPSGQIEFLSPRTIFSTGYRGYIRRYLDVDQLNGFDQRLNVSVRRLATKRLTFYLTDSFVDVPTTDEVELNGVPFSRTGTRTNSLAAGLTARLTKFTDLTVRYDNTWVTFDRGAEAAQNYLLGGTVNGGYVELSHRITERASAGAEYAIRLADINEGLRQLTFHDAGGTFRYTLGPHTSFTAAAGMSYLIDKEFDENRTGPYFRLGITHALERATIGASYDRTNVPSFGLGGSSENQEVRGFVRMPFARNRFYVQSSAAWRRSIPFIETSLQLDTIWLRSTVGYSAARWLRLEGFHAYTRQDSIVTGGEIDRQRAGFQVVISQPVRIR